MNELIDTAGGLLGGVGSLYDGDTMTIANQLASGVQSTVGELSRGILGDTAQSLANDVNQAYSNVLNSAQTVQNYQNALNKIGVKISLVVKAPSIVAPVVTKAKGTLSMVKTAMEQGAAKVNSLKQAVGQNNGAKNILTASLEKAINSPVAAMMKSIATMIKTAHGISHPLFLLVFKMTWSENKHWAPGWGESKEEWMKP